MIRLATVDIETPNIPDLVTRLDKIFCISVKINNEPTKCFTYLYTPYSDGNLKQALNLMNTADLIVGHNFYKFDKPVIEKVLGKITTPIVDTLIDSKLTFPKDKLKSWDYSRKDFPSSLVGSYSLQAFGLRLGLNKIDYHDFSGLCEDMVTYCKRDVDLTYELYCKLIAHPDYPSAKVRELEYKVAEIIFKQQEYGFWFDIDKARDLSTRLKFRQMNLEHKLLKIFPPRFEPDGEVATYAKEKKFKVYNEITLSRHINIMNYFSSLPITKNGKYKFPPKSMKWSDKPYKLTYNKINGEFQRIKLVKFNPNSRQQIAKRLIDTFNWKPTTFTDKGNIKVDESILGELSDDLEE